ncbi:MAG TPA: 30S ribosomal protein S20 [Candidatus Saccharimonadales bacterium]|jgi:small subunit ribosomal protein S20|nr:30S ribosomal protein S20 [Candidatus Saccharimonadales bacterium]
MPIIKSAKKRVRVSNKAAIRNSKSRRSFKSALKLFAKTPSAESLGSAQSNLDKAAKKGVIHKNKAARLKKRAAAKAKAAGVKPTAAKKAAPAKAAKPAAKKTPAKKPAAKK